MDGFRKLIGELHRRSIWQVLAIYLAGSWIALQVVDTLAETLDLPEWAPGLAFMLLVVGLPIVLATAFVQEGRGLGSDDDRESGMDAEVDASLSDTWADSDPNLPLGSQESLEAALSLFTWRNAVGGGVAAFALWGILSAGWFFFGPGFGGEEATGTVVGTPGAAADAVQSIAVLPFANMSGTDEAEPFTVGIHDDILTQLSKIGALQVTSRTSVLDYRESSKPIREIAAELGVNSILEGGVQTAPNRVRINVQLIDAASDRHLWAETFDRELTAENVFEIQSEIALSVAEALRAELAPEEQAAIAVVPTTDLDALALYHRGRELFADRTEPQSASEAEVVLESAVAKDTNFAAAWAELAKTRSWLLGWGSADEAGVHEALDRTSALAPGSFETEMAEGYFSYYGRRDYLDALGYFDAAAGLRPTDIDAIQARALILRRLGRWDESVAAFEQAAVLDPRSSSVLRFQAETLGRLRRYDESFAQFDRAVRLEPEDASLLGEYFDYVMAGGDTTRAADLMRNHDLVNRPETWQARQSMADARGNFEAALEAVQGVPASEIPLSEAIRFWQNGYYSQLAGDMDAGRTYGDSLLTLVEGIETPFVGVREAMLARALVLTERNEEARSAARACLQRADPSNDQVDGTVITTICLWTLAAAGAPAEAIDGLIEIADYPNRDLSVGRLEHASWYRMYLSEQPRYPELVEKLEAIERAAATQ
jgi:TolB-like protein